MPLDLAAVGPVMERADVHRALTQGTAPKRRWTAIIPAAGRGTRLGFDKPKILFEIAGVTILDRMIGLLSPFVDRMVFVLSPEGRSHVEPLVEAMLGVRGTVAVQPEPTGMADAVACGLQSVSTENTLVVWGDQVSLRPESISSCIRLHDLFSPSATVPTLLRQDPYIHFERDDTGRLLRVAQKREGDSLPDYGEGDCGLFLFRTDALRQYLPALARDPSSRGKLTGEANFLPLLPILDGETRAVLSARVVTLEESIGVNTRKEAEYLSDYIARCAGVAV